MVQQSSLSTFGFVWSWCISYSTKLYHQGYSFWAWRFCHGLAFGVLVRSGGSLGKQSSALIALQIVCLLTSTCSGGQLLPCMRFENGSHSPTRRACGWCLRFKHYCRQTRPLIRVLPSCSVWSWQRFECMPLLCCFAVRFGRQFEGGRQLRSSVWCQGSSKAMTRTSSWKMNFYQTQLSLAGRGVRLPRLRWP